MEQFLTRAKTQGGYSLIGTVMMVVVLGLGLAAGLSVYKSHSQQEKIEKNRNLQLAVKDAMQAYRGQNGRYPFPAPMNAAPDTAAFGNETSTAVTGGTWTVAGRGGRQVHIGAIPTRTLNIDDKLMVDAFGSRILYAVTEAYASSGAPFDQDLGAISIEGASGNSLTGTPGNVIYTVVLPGPDIRGAYSFAGTLKEPCNTASEAGENCNNTDAVFTSNSFIRDIDTDEKFTAALEYESGRAETELEVSAWTLQSCDTTTCGRPSEVKTQTRNASCKVVGSGQDLGNLARCGRNATTIALSTNYTCAATGPCAVTGGFGSGGGGEAEQGYDSDGDGRADNSGGRGEAVGDNNSGKGLGG